MRVIVVGSGLAGLLAAIEAADAGADVLLVTKGALADANTTRAQGGIAAAVFPDDSVASHLADTLAAGAALCDPAAVEVLCGEGPDRVRELVARGVRFDRDGAALARGLEGAHAVARVLHAGGDATGAEIERALIAAVAREARVTVREHAALAELVTESVSDGEPRRVVGVELAPSARAGGAAGTAASTEAGTGASNTIEWADAVVLATGGAGQLFAHTTNPAVATGDGIAAAWRAGAAIADAEFYQFHPTALAAPGSFLISEAVRGEGAVLLNARGERFMNTELAPRDVVARAIAAEMRAQGGAPVVLDATGLGASVLARRFPTIDAATRAAGFDWARQPIPVTPAAHYWMGGISTDASGRSSLPGLWAVGECASTGVHGANRLASNSLLEAAVFAHRAAADVLTIRPAALVGQHDAGQAQAQAQAQPAGGFSRELLQRLMWECAGLQRSGEGLEHAASVLADWEAASLEDRNLLDVARLVVDFALAREESRGAHFRTDFPLPRPEFARRRVRTRERASVC